jgi:hypothetical protein
MTLPKIVYKYRNWVNQKHKDLLINNEIFLSGPQSFNDPFDCRIPTNFYLLDSEDKIKRFVDNKTIEHFEVLNREGRNIEEEIRKLEKRLTEDLSGFQKESENILYNTQDKNYGILSLSKRWDSILMWSHYSDCHKGYCVGFNEIKLRMSGSFGKGGDVFYSDDFPQISPFDDDLMENSFTETHYKALDWQYEQEYRLTKLFYPEAPKTEDRIVNIPHDVFEEVYLGLNMDDQHKSEIIEIAKLKNIKVYQVVKIPFKFTLGRIEI